MIAYHLRRVFRNKFCARFPNLYRTYIQQSAGNVPRIDDTKNKSLDLAREVAQFYIHEYQDSYKDVHQGIVTLFRKKVDFGKADQIDWHYHNESENDFQLWRQKLGHMGFVCPMLAQGDEKELQTISFILSGYRKNAKFTNRDCFSSYWFPYSVSHRVLAILSGYLIAEKKGTLSNFLKEEIVEFLRWNIGFILKNVEHELKNNHVERNLAALCLYFNCVGNVEETLARQIDKDVHDYISECVLDDGMNIERSVMYQGFSAMGLNIFTNTEFLSQKTRLLAEDRYEKALRAWALMSHPDGQISLYNDSWFGEVPEVAHIGKRPEFRALETLPESGYVRIERGDYFLIFDAGAIGPRWNPGHGHADFLSVEVDIEAVRFIVDPGTYQYSTGPRRKRERAAQSHNGPCWTSVDPVEYHGCFKVARLAEARLSSASESGETVKVEGTLKVRQGEVRRSITATNEKILFLDNWSGRSEQAEVKLLIQGEWVLADSSKERMTFTRDSKAVSVVIHLGKVSKISESSWACRYLESRTATEVTLLPETSASSTAYLSWSIER